MTYENQTDHTVTVFRDGAVGPTLGPFEERESGLFDFDGAITFRAKDENGRVVYSETLTWEELKKRGWKIVITEDMLSPTPTEGQ